MEVGEKYKLFFNKKNPNNGTVEIRAIVDDKHVVYKYHGKYVMDSALLFELYIVRGYLTKVTSNG